MSRVFKPGDTVRILRGCGCSKCEAEAKKQQAHSAEKSGAITTILSEGSVRLDINLRHGLALDTVSYRLEGAPQSQVQLWCPGEWLERHWDGREPLADSEVEDWVKRLVRQLPVKEHAT